MATRYLILQDGTTFKGVSFGASALSYEQLSALEDLTLSSGELVFNTSMSSYTEVLTDNSYAGQMVVMSNVHIGTYGCDPSWFQHLTSKPLCAGFIVKELYRGIISENRISFDALLNEFDICGIEQIDTRLLTIHLRNNGSMYAVFVDEDDLQQKQIDTIVSKLQNIQNMSERDFISLTETQQIQHLKSPDGTMKVAYIDYGSKKAIIDEILKRGGDVDIIPASFFLKMEPEEFSSYDCVFLSNGPGDPRYLDDHIIKVKSLLGKIAVRGICLGHQIIALALDCRVKKMKFGHHGSNHPVKDTVTGKIIITSQNHNYSVDPDSLETTASPWFINLNDQSLEGLIDRKWNVMCTQFHPEAAAGSHDGLWIFDSLLTKENF
ncbi:MAG: glutamine-hydrolyzing carbamoyl-phosphate synthase small subunit [Sphaerochaetaceae bacterium]|nr:glutamine-hydrolyzing carbamoyl-phosphate synthase small subunit [Sphaerochaetaceae bacterium]